jgi:hypothetical protein
MKMSEFPEIQPFGPRPASHNPEPSSEAQPVESTPAAAPAAIEPPQNHPNLTLAILTGVGAGFLLGYLFSRYEQTILRQTKLDEFLEYAQDWIQEQGPKITEPIRQGLESTSSTVEETIKKVRAANPLDSLSFLNRPKRRKFLGIEF